MTMAMHQCSVIHNAPAIYSSSEQRPPARVSLPGPPPLCPKGAWFYQELARHPILYHTTYAPRCTRSMWKTLGQTPQGISRISNSAQAILSLSDQMHGNYGCHGHPGDQDPNQKVPIWCAGCPVKTANSFSSNQAKVMLLKSEPVVVPSDVQIENQSETYHNIVDRNAINCLRNSGNSLFYGGCLYSSIYDALERTDDQSQMSLSQFIEQDSGIDSMRSNAVTPAPSGEEEEDYNSSTNYNNQILVSSPPPSCVVSANGNGKSMEESAANVCITSGGQQMDKEHSIESSANSRVDLCEDNIPSSTSTELQKIQNEEGVGVCGGYKVSVDHSYSSLMSVEFQQSHQPSQCHAEKHREKNLSEFFRSATPIDGGVHGNQTGKGTDNNFRSSTPIESEELLHEYNHLPDLTNHPHQSDVYVEESGFEAESTNDDIALQSHVISSAQCREVPENPGTCEEASSDDERLLICTSKDDLDDTEIIFVNQAADMECNEGELPKDSPSLPDNLSMSSDELIEGTDLDGSHSDKDGQDSYYDDSLSRLSKEGKLPSFLAESMLDEDEGIDSTQPFSLQESLQGLENQVNAVEDTGNREQGKENTQNMIETDNSGISGKETKEDVGDVEQRQIGFERTPSEIQQYCFNKDGRDPAGVVAQNTVEEQPCGSENQMPNCQAKGNSNSNRISSSIANAEVLTGQQQLDNETEGRKTETILQQTATEVLDLKSDVKCEAAANKGEKLALKLPHIQEFVQKTPDLEESVGRALDSCLQGKQVQKDLQAKPIHHQEMVADETAEGSKAKNLDGYTPEPNNSDCISPKITEENTCGAKKTVNDSETFTAISEIMMQPNKARLKLETIGTSAITNIESLLEENTQSTPDHSIDIKQGDDEDKNSSKESIWQPWLKDLKPTEVPETRETQTLPVISSAGTVTQKSIIIDQSQQDLHIHIKQAFNVTPQSVKNAVRNPVDTTPRGIKCSAMSGSSEKHTLSTQYPGVVNKTEASDNQMLPVPQENGKPILPVSQRKCLPSLDVSSSCLNFYKSGLLRFNQHGTPTSNLPSFAMFKQATPTELQMWKAFNPLLPQKQQQQQQNKQPMNQQPNTTNVAVVNPTGGNAMRHYINNSQSNKGNINIQHHAPLGSGANVEKQSELAKSGIEKVGVVSHSSGNSVSIASDSMKSNGMASQSSSSSSEQESLVSKKPAKSLNPLAVYWMTEWLNRHMSNPYPTTVEKKHLAKAGGITMAQVSSWFANKRARMGIKGKKVPNPPQSVTQSSESLIVEATKNVQFTPGSIYVGCRSTKQKLHQFAGMVGKENTVSPLEKIKDDAFARIGKHKRGLSDVSNIGHNSSSDIVYHTAKKQKSSTFRKTARKVSRKMWWRNIKMTLLLICITVVILTVLVVIILYATGVFSHDKSGGHTTTTVATPHSTNNV